METKQSPYIFSDRVNRKLPLYLRMMEEIDLSQTDELYQGFRFSTSKRHYSKAYINRSNYKPQSSFMLGQYLNKHSK